MRLVFRDVCTHTGVSPAAYVSQVDPFCLIYFQDFSGVRCQPAENFTTVLCGSKEDPRSRVISTMVCQPIFSTVYTFTPHEVVGCGLL
jgi:hypothetical protein